MNWLELLAGVEEYYRWRREHHPPYPDLLLEWGPALTNCPVSGPSVTFNVYRGEDPNFPVDATTRIAAGSRASPPTSRVSMVAKADASWRTT